MEYTLKNSILENKKYFAIQALVIIFNLVYLFFFVGNFDKIYAPQLLDLAAKIFKNHDNLLFIFLHSFFNIIPIIAGIIIGYILKQATFGQKILLSLINSLIIGGIFFAFIYLFGESIISFLLVLIPCHASVSEECAMGYMGSFLSQAVALPAVLIANILGILYRHFKEKENTLKQCKIRL